MIRSVQTAGRLLFRSSQRETFLRPLIKAGAHSTNPEYFNRVEPYEIYRSRFLNAFNDQTLDSWWVRHWLLKLHQEDSIPPPEVVESALRACRRLNDIALAIRFLETIRLKCKVVSGSWDWMQKEIDPTMKELGIPTLATLGYEKPQLAFPDPDDCFT
ncbi:cytochrome c oxidase subunit Va [Opisthorchis viverrini]|uniref:Cytochrome c oxidase subunit 5A, mitochondrial n=2 Tax=Opisthorchis viverrini TaxID=6198 RepID=A0A074ZX53_OPIVI|nr:hypothetical protein T265_11550 [Opisthorchis viverrini]KER19754.1 hypothetical protein T265_11550 [Opisthorchis viverrini]OON21378.1 cytochrome c oxidase subunit Va [Opisthorchis viverrini]